MASISTLAKSWAETSPALSRHGLRALGNRLDFALALLCSQQIIKSRLRLELLFDAHFEKIALRSLHAGASCGIAQDALVTALPGPVKADRFINPLVGQQTAGADAMLQINRARLHAEQRQRRVISSEQVAMGAINGSACNGDIKIFSCGAQSLTQAEYRCIHCLRNPWPGSKQDCDDKNVRKFHQPFIGQST